MDHAAAVEEHKHIVRRVYEEFTNQRKLELASELFGAEFVDHGSPADRAGIAGVQESVRAFVAAFPDFQFQIESMIA